MKKPIIWMVSAFDQNQAIGKNGEVPFDLPNDKNFYLNFIKGNSYVFGRKSFEDFTQNGIDNSNYYVLTNTKTYDHSNVQTINDFDYIFDNIKDERELVVLGGEKVYEAMLPYADYLVLTYVNTAIKDADTFFPSFNKNDFRVLMKQNGVVDHDNQLQHTFYLLKRE